MTGYVYRHIWPVLDDGMTLRELATEADPELDMALAAAKVHRCGKAKWEIATDADGDPVLVVNVPCVQPPNARPTRERPAEPRPIDEEMAREFEFDRMLDAAGLSNHDRMWRSRVAS